MLLLSVLLAVIILTLLIQPKFGVHVILISFLLVIGFKPVEASQCPTFTQEQQQLIKLAYTVGSQHNSDIYRITGTHIGHTLAAIIWKESFIGHHVIRYSTDPSFGVGQMKITTWFWLNEINYSYANRHYYEHKAISDLMTNDLYAITQTYKYLKLLIRQHESLHMARIRYNGRGAAAERYAEDVLDRVRVLTRCGIV